MIVDAFQVLISPRRYMAKLGAHEVTHRGSWAFIYIALWTILPAAAFYYGTVHNGWTIGDRVIAINQTTGIALAVCFYLVLNIVTIWAGYLLSWMSGTYHARFEVMEGIETAGLAATPIYIAGIAAVYPIFWLDLLIAVVAVTISARILPIAIKERLKLPSDLVFLYSLSMFAALLVIACSILGASTFAWSYLVTPVFVELTPF